MSGVRVPAPLTVFQGFTGIDKRHNNTRGNNTVTFHIKKDRPNVRAVIIEEALIPNTEAFPSSH
jgi:hypothetical protein